MAHLHLAGRIAHGAGGVLEEHLLLGCIHQVEELAGLGVVIAVILAEIPVIGSAFQSQGRLLEFGLLLPFTVAVGLIAQRAAVIAVHAHLTVAVVAVRAEFWRVHRDRMVVDAQAVALRVAVGEQASLQHLVGREADAGHHVGRVESGLLHVREVVLGIAVELHHAHLDQREFLLVPDLGQVEGIVGHFLRLLLGHHLDEELPAREILALDGFKEIALVTFAVLGDDGFRLGIRQVLDALLADPVEFHPGALIFGIDQAEGVGAKAVHVAVAGGDAALAHGDGHLVQRFGQRSPEIPVVLRAAHVGARIALDGVVEIGEFERIAQEEDGGVVAHQVPVAFLGVELDGKAADIALGIRRAALAGDGGEAHEELGLLADLGEDLRPGVAGDIVGDGEGTEGAGSLGVHAPFGDHFAVEMRQLFKKPDVLQQLRSALAGGDDVLVVGDGCPRDGGELLFLVHLYVLFYWNGLILLLTIILYR